MTVYTDVFLGKKYLAVSIKVPGETLKPVLMLQVPLGIDLTSCVTVKIDDNYKNQRGRRD